MAMFNSLYVVIIHELVLLVSLIYYRVLFSTTVSPAVCTVTFHYYGTPRHGVCPCDERPGCRKRLDRKAVIRYEVARRESMS